MQKSILDNVTTLEEARQQIALLSESQKNAHYFLYIFCNYAIKEPLLLIKGYAELLKKTGYTDEHQSFVEKIMTAEQKILNLINTVGFLALDERMKYDQPQENPRSFQSEAIVLEPFLTKAKSEIQQIAERENVKPHRSLQVDKQNDHIQRIAPIQTHFNIGSDLPAVKSHPALLESSIIDAISFLTQQHSIAELFIRTIIEEETVKLVFGCSASTPNTYMLKDFLRFETASSIFEFDPNSLSLYQNWLYLKTHEGMLSLDIQDNTGTQQSSIASVTISLKRWQ